MMVLNSWNCLVSSSLTGPMVGVLNGIISDLDAYLNIKLVHYEKNNIGLAYIPLNGTHFKIAGKYW